MAKNCRGEFDKAVLLAQMVKDTMVWRELDHAGKIAEQYWENLAQGYIGTVEHTLARSGYVVHPGDYLKSIRFHHIPGGVRVGAWDFKGNWIENGSVHNAAHSPCAQTRAFMISQGFHAA